MRMIINIFVSLILTFTLVGCVEPSTSDKQEAQRDRLMDRANAKVQIPSINNFVARKSVAEYMKRMDQSGKLFYIYILADTGNMIGYYVSRTQPINICTFMAPTDRIDRNGTGPSFLRPAPANDGLYYGDGACNVDYFFDAETDTLIQIKDMKLFISDQPLDVDVEAFKIKPE